MGRLETVRFPWVTGDAPRVYYASDLAHTVLTYPRIDAPPGTFRYDDYAPNVVGAWRPRRPSQAWPSAIAMAGGSRPRVNSWRWAASGKSCTCRATRTVLVRLGRDGHDGEELGFREGRETNVSIASRFRRIAARLGAP